MFIVKRKNIKAKVPPLKKMELKEALDWISSQENKDDYQLKRSKDATTSKLKSNLEKELEELQDALDNESNDEMRSEIIDSINKVKDLINNS